jgi:predicted nucleic acid-binding protein
MGRQRFGPSARRAFLADLAAARLAVATLEHPDYATIIDLDARYADLELGLADCALIVLAARHRTTRILSFDERHFRAVTPLHGDAFTLLPADA